jgi:hypothetical protein
MKDVVGRNDGNTKVIFPAVDIPDSEYSHTLRTINPGDFVVVQVSFFASCCFQHSTVHFIAFIVNTVGVPAFVSLNLT